MSEPIGVGDWVECIRADPDFARIRALTLGAVYQVSRVFEIGPSFDDAGEIILALSGVDPGLNDQGYPYEGFSPDRFRPIYRPKSELIEGLKTPTFIGFDPAHGEDAVVRALAKMVDGRLEIIDIEYDK